MLILVSFLWVRRPYPLPVPCATIRDGRVSATSAENDAKKRTRSDRRSRVGTTRDVSNGERDAYRVAISRRGGERARRARGGVAGTHRDGHERAARRDGRIVTLANNHLVRNEGGGGVKREGHVCVDGGGATDTSKQG